MKSKLVILFIATLIVLSCSRTEQTVPQQASTYKPESKELYDSIVAMDAKWEDAYNNCKVDMMDQVISEDLEFYHDQGGLQTSKQALLDAVEKNICGKVTGNC